MEVAKATAHFKLSNLNTDSMGSDYMGGTVI